MAHRQDENLASSRQGHAWVVGARYGVPLQGCDPVGGRQITSQVRNDGMLRRRQETAGRAQRFPIRVPIRFRTPRSRDWFEACTENVSRSGVMFRSDCVFEPNTDLDLRIELPPLANGDKVHGEIVCKGKVVRVEQTGIAPTLAVAIRHYRLTQKRLPN